MRPSDRLKDVDALESVRIILEKTEKTPEIKKAFAAFGYSSDILNEGKEILKTTRKLYEEDIRKKDEYSLCSAAFSRKRKEVDEKYRLHRNKARIIARGDLDMIQGLAADGKYHQKFPMWLEQVRKFYITASKNPEYQKKLMRLKITKEEIDKGLADIKEIEDLHAKFILNKGISKQSTVDKRRSFKALHDWRKEFYAVARLALKNSPDHLETLYKAT